MEPKIKEECGIFGVYNPKENNTTFLALRVLQHRGQDACGAAGLVNGEIKYFKELGLVSKVFSEYKNVSKLLGSKIEIGHVRYATTGKNIVENAHPFVFNKHGYNMALVHNGNLVNSKEIRKTVSSHGIYVSSTSDTELICHLFYLSKEKTVLDKLADVCKQIEGAFSLMIIINDKLYAIRDKFAIRPLVIGEKNGSYFFSSEMSALTINEARLVREVKPAEIIEVAVTGMKSIFYTKQTKMLPCSMEYIYFSRPDNIINGIVVQEFRKKSGHILAKLFPAKADLIIPVPDSATSCALGYAEETGIPLEFGLIKNRYVARSFIAPDSRSRETMVREKLMANSHTLKGKEIVLVDDSIVRGTTIKTIIQLIHKAGVKAIHLRIGAPEFKFPAVYGIDVSSKSELISNNMTKNELKEFLNVDSLEFLPIESINKLLNHETLLTYFNGIYPTKKGDINE